jgi:hypothetical protein
VSAGKRKKLPWYGGRGPAAAGLTRAPVTRSGIARFKFGTGPDRRGQPTLQILPMPDYEQELSKIYHRRFVRTAAYRNRVWEVLTRSFFQPMGPPGSYGARFGLRLWRVHQQHHGRVEVRDGSQPRRRIPAQAGRPFPAPGLLCSLAVTPPTRSTPFSRAIFSSIFPAKRISVSRCAMLSAVSNQAAVSWQSAPM